MIMHKQGFKDLRLGDLWLSWEGCMKSTIPVIRRTLVEWYPPTRGTLKFNVDGAFKGKPGPTGIGGVLRDHLGSIRVVFSEPVDLEESNEAEFLSIRRALTLGTSLGGIKLEVESDSSNAIKWAKGVKRPP